MNSKTTQSDLSEHVNKISLSDKKNQKLLNFHTNLNKLIVTANAIRAEVKTRQGLEDSSTDVVEKHSDNIDFMPLPLFKLGQIYYWGSIKHAHKLLNLKLSDLQNKSYAEIEVILAKRYREISLFAHPDKCGAGDRSAKLLDLLQKSLETLKLYYKFKEASQKGFYNKKRFIFALPLIVLPILLVLSPLIIPVLALLYIIGTIKLHGREAFDQKTFAGFFSEQFFQPPKQSFKTKLFAICKTSLKILLAVILTPLAIVLTSAAIALIIVTVVALAIITAAVIAFEKVYDFATSGINRLAKALKPSSSKSNTPKSAVAQQSAVVSVSDEAKPELQVANPANPTEPSAVSTLLRFIEANPAIYKASLIDIDDQPSIEIEKTFNSKI